MSESSVINILTSYQDIFETSNILSSIMRFLIWGLIKIIASISNGIENIIEKIYTLNGFFASKAIVDLFDKFLPVVWILLAISIGLLGFRIMYDRDFKKDKVIQNTLIAIITIVMLPTLMTQLSKATNYGVQSLDEVVGNTSSYSANKIIKDNLYDLHYMDSFDFSSRSKKNNLNEKYITHININETVHKKNIENKKLFENKLRVDSNGELGLEKLDKGVFDFNQEDYYRFSIDYLTIIVTLLCTIVVLLATSFKASRIIYELAFVGIFARLLAFSDISNGQKTKEVIKHIVNTFIVLFFIALLLKLYLVFVPWLNEEASIHNIKLDSISKIVILVGASIGVVDGPNIIERILGIDAGIKSGWSVVMGGVSTAKAIGSTAKSLGSATKSLSDLSKKAFSKANSIESNHLKSSLEQDMNSKNDNKSTNSIDKNNKNDSLSSQMKNSDIANEKLSRKNMNNDIDSNKSAINGVDSNNNDINSTISDKNENPSDSFTGGNIENESNTNIGDNSEVLSNSSIGENIENESNTSIGDISEILSNSSIDENIESDLNTNIGDSNEVSSNNSIGENIESNLNSSIRDNSGIYSNSSSGNPIDNKDIKKNPISNENRNPGILNPSIYGIENKPTQNMSNGLNDGMIGNKSMQNMSSRPNDAMLGNKPTQNMSSRPSDSIVGNKPTQNINSRLSDSMIVNNQTQNMSSKSSDSIVNHRQTQDINKDNDNVLGKINVSINPLNKDKK